MSWGTELWDQYDKVAVHTDVGIEFIKRVSTFVEKRISAEQNYAKELRRLAKGFRKKDEEESKYTAVKGFVQLISETNDYAGQRELIAEYLEAEVLNPLKELAKDISVERRKHLATGADLHRSLKNQLDTLDRTKKQYEKTSEEAENAMHTLEKADNDPNSTKAKIDKLTITLRQKEQTAEECRNTYILQLEKCNAFRRNHLDSDMPALFSEFQDMNARRISKYKELLGQFAECHRRVHPVVNTCLDNITKASDEVSAEEDNQRIVDTLKTGFPIPGNLDFEEYQGKHNKKSAQKKSKQAVEPREDYSHLPPEQQKRKLQHKVDSLEAQISKANADKTAMEKMQTIYTQNPKLGDPNAIAQSLEQNSIKISEIQAELDKFKGWLTKVKEGKSTAPVPPKPQQLGPPPSSKRTASASKKSPVFGKKNKKDKKKDKAVNNENGSPRDQSDDDDDDEGSPSMTSPPRGIGAGIGGGVDKGNESFSEPEPDEPEEQGGADRNGLMLYDFEGQNDDELSCVANESVTILEDLGDGWLRVRRGQDEGYVPQAYVQIVE